MSSEGRFVTQLFALILALLELGGLVGSYNTAYRDLLNHESVKHSIQELVKTNVHTNGVDCLCSMLKRGYVGTFQHFPPKHCRRYVRKFVGRHNVREMETLDQMGLIVWGMVAKLLHYRDLIA